jgi:prepilin-type processing-associated H-X9-DG protein
MRIGKNNQAGFVLIDLVVSVAIIALLAAILTPVLATARKQVLQYDCSSRQRQLGKAILMYTQDYDEGLPVCAAFNRYSQQTISSWDAAVSTYTSYQGPVVETAALAASGAIFRCPLDRIQKEGDAPRSFAMPIAGNACMGDNEGVAGNWVYDSSSLYTHSRMLAELPDQSGTMLLVEFHHPLNRLFGGWAAGIHGPVYVPGECGTGPLAQERPEKTVKPSSDSMSHLGGYNYTFADGHAKWMQAIQTMGTAGKPGDPQGPWTIADND